jgi:hypothetical protein
MKDCWPFGIVLWGMVPNHHMRRWLKTVVVSDVEKAHVMRQVGTREMTTVLRVESIEATSEPDYSNGSGRSLAGAHVLARRCPAQRWHEPCLRLS